MNDLVRKGTKRLKETVRLRSKKLSNGEESLYLDIYFEGTRRYEFLKMYLLPEVSIIIKEQNRATFAAAEAIKFQRTIDLINSKAGIKPKKEKIRLTEWLDRYREICVNKGLKNREKLECVIKIILKYDKKGSTQLLALDKTWALGFIEWLTKTYRKKNGGKLSRGTVFFYVSQITTILNLAVRHEFMSENPFAKLSQEDKIRKPESNREYLTHEELKRLIKTKCKSEIVKQAYLFSCFCGLRISDILKLKYENLVSNSGRYMIALIMQKTSRPVYIPLSKRALEWLPSKSGNDLIFYGLPCVTTINNILKKWSGAAGIYKKITFHTARHTFGTLMITAGADLYTTSKLMGHSDVRTTQIYARIVDSKKIEAAHLIDRLFKR